MPKPFYEKTVRENSIQGEAIEFAKMRGWFAEAMQSKSRNGFPDTFLARRGRIVLVEFKKRGERPTPQQELRHFQLRAEGVEVAWFDNLEDFKKFIR